MCDDDGVVPLTNAELDALWDTVTEARPQCMAAPANVGSRRRAAPPGSSGDDDADRGDRKRTAAAMIGIQSGEASFDVDKLRGKQRDPKRHRILPEDGTWVDEDAADPGLRFGPAWREEEITRQQILESDPNFQFITLVAGASNTTVERLFDEDSVGAAMRRRIAEKQAVLAGQEAVVDLDRLQVSLAVQKQNRGEAVRMQVAVLERQTAGFLATAKAHTIATTEYVESVHARRRRVDLANMLEATCAPMWIADELSELALRVIDAEFADDETGGIDPVDYEDETVAKMAPRTISELMLSGEEAHVAEVLDAVEAEARDEHPRSYIRGADIRRTLRGLHASGWSADPTIPAARGALCIALRRFVVLKYARPNDRADAVADFLEGHGDVLAVDDDVRDNVRDAFREKSWKPWLREAEALVVFLDTAVDLLKAESPLTSPTEESDARLTREELALARGKTVDERRAAAEAQERRAAAQERRLEAQEVDRHAAAVARERRLEAEEARKGARRTGRLVDKPEEEEEEDLFEGEFPGVRGGIRIGAPGDDDDDQVALAVRSRARADRAGWRIMQVTDDPDIKRYERAVAAVRDVVDAAKARARRTVEVRPEAILREAGVIGGPDLQRDTAFANSGPRLGESPDPSDDADMKKWIDAVAWFEELDGRLIEDLGVEFPMSSNARDDARGGRDIPEQSRAQGMAPRKFTVRMQRLWYLYMPMLVSADEKVAARIRAADASGARPSLTLSERIVYQTLRGVTPEQALRVGMSDIANLVNNSILVQSARLYEADLAIAAEKLRVTLGELDTLIATTTDRIDKMMRGEAAVRSVPTVPYEHRRGWVEQPGHSGVVHLIPIVTQSIAAAWNRLRRLAPNVAGVVDIEFAQHDPQMRPDFADLVAIEMAIIAQRFPKQYIQLGQRAHTMTDLLSVIKRFRNNFEFKRVPGGEGGAAHRPYPVPGRDSRGNISAVMADVAPSGQRRGNMILF